MQKMQRNNHFSNFEKIKVTYPQSDKYDFKFSSFP